MQPRACDVLCPTQAAVDAQVFDVITATAQARSFPASNPQHSPPDARAGAAAAAAPSLALLLMCARWNLEPFDLSFLGLANDKAASSSSPKLSRDDFFGFELSFLLAAGGGGGGASAASSSSKDSLLRSWRCLDIM